MLAKGIYSGSLFRVGICAAVLGVGLTASGVAVSASAADADSDPVVLVGDEIAMGDDDGGIIFDPDTNSDTSADGTADVSGGSENASVTVDPPEPIDAEGTSDAGGAEVGAADDGKASTEAAGAEAEGTASGEQLTCLPVPDAWVSDATFDDEGVLQSAIVEWSVSGGSEYVGFDIVEAVPGVLLASLPADARFITVPGQDLHLRPGQSIELTDVRGICDDGSFISSIVRVQRPGIPVDVDGASTATAVGASDAGGSASATGGVDGASATTDAVGTALASATADAEGAEASAGAATVGDPVAGAGPNGAASTVAVDAPAASEPSAAGTVSGGRLADTGATGLSLTTGGVALVLAGVVLAAVARRRQAIDAD